MKRTFFKVFALAVMLVLIAPLVGGGHIAPATAQEEVTLGVVFFAWQPCDLLNEISKDFTAETGINVEVSCVPYPEFYDKVFTDFANQTGNDLIVIDSQWVGEASTGGHLIEITDWMKENLDIDNFYEPTMKAYGEYPMGSGHFWAVALEADTEGLFHRKDLWENEEEQAAFEEKYGYPLAPPEKLSQMRDMAEFFTRKKGEKLAGQELDKDFYGIAMKFTKAGDGVSCDWNDILWSFGGALWDAETKTVEGYLNSDIGVRAVEFAQELFKFQPPGSGNWYFDEVNSAFSNGDVAMIKQWYAFAPALIDPTSNPDYYDKVGFAVWPGEEEHYISLGGQGIGISAYTKYPDESYQYIKWLQSEETQWKWVKGGGYTSLKSIMATQEFLDAAPYNAAFAESLPSIRDFWNLPEYAKMLEVQQEYLNLAITGQMDAKEALDIIAEEQQLILDEAYP